MAPAETMNERGGQLIVLRSWVLLTALSLLSPLSLAQTEPPGILWQSRNTTFNALESEFAGFWRGVLSMNLDGAKPPKTTAIIPQGKQISEVLRERMLYDGKSMPRQLDILTCLLNEHVCKATPGKDGDMRAPDASAKWTIQPNAEIVVPDIKFEPLLVHKPYDKTAGESLEDIVARRQGCVQFDAACERYVMNLNRRIDKPLDRSYAGKIIVPTKAYRALIPVVPGVDLETLMKSNAALATRAVSPAKAELRSTAGAPAPGSAAQLMDRVLLLQTISHPLAKVPNLVFPGTAHSTVAVMDAWVDPKHCMLDRVKVWDPEKLGGDVPKAADCGESGVSVRATDHGTHVVGLIGARLGVKGGPGVNPYAAIHALCMDEGRFSSALYVSNLMQRLLALYQDNAPTVVNMSFAYQPLAGFADILRDTIVDAQHNTVFVAAAGNDKVNMSHEGACTVGPACYDLPNVIVVAALDQNADAPQLWSERAEGLDGSKPKGSNYGDRVHVAAPGQGILSTISGDRVGPFDGTSQAAPLVAGAVSLLHHQSSGMQSPADVKDRVIYTSDLFSSLYDKMRGGRLNVTRLLEIQRAIVVTRGGKIILAAKRPQHQRVAFTEVGTDRRIDLRFPLIQRLKFNADLNHYTLFFYEDEDGPLQRAFVMLNSEPTLNFSVQDPGKPLRIEAVALVDIFDYTAPMR